VRLLLDTHALLWFGLNDPQLSTIANLLITDARNEKLVSPASYWEIAIKIALKKYSLKKPYEDFMHEVIDLNGFTYLHIEPRHTARLIALPQFKHHKDPFDRLLVAQALAQGVSIISNDPRLDAYGVTRLW
jgi:PIN domain nuclease of toxin-antitoxin system